MDHSILIRRKEKGENEYTRCQKKETKKENRKKDKKEKREKESEKVAIILYIIRLSPARF